MPSTGIAVPSGSYTLGDFLQTPYGLKGEVLPENAVELQSINRKRQIANLLAQRSMAPRQGQMAGRFYVGPGWGQGVEQIGQALAGVYMNKNLDTQQRGVMDEDAKMRAQAVQDFMGKLGPQTTQQTIQGPGAPTLTDTGREMADQINETGPRSVPPQEGQSFYQRQDPYFTEGAQPTGPVTQPPSREQITQALMQGQMSRIPEVQRAAQWQATQQAHADDMAVRKAEHDADLALRKQGMEVNAGIKKAMDENTQQFRMLDLGMRSKDLDLRHKEVEQRLRDARLTNEEKNALLAEKNDLLAERNEIERLKAEAKGTGLSATAQKELIQTDEQIQGGHAAIKGLDSALALNDKAMGFTGAGAVAAAGSFLPEAVRPGAVDATVDLDNIVMSSALPQLKEIFGGMPTEGERKVLLEMQGSSSKTPAQRKQIFERAKEAVQRRIEFNQQKAKQIREGKYFGPTGGVSSSTQGPTPAPSGGPAAPQPGGALTPDEQAELDMLRKKYGR